MPKNCWEVMGCGREQGGVNAASLGVCSAATCQSHHGSNLGQSGGRSCWQVAGSVGGNCDCHLVPSPGDCMDCGFYKRVRYEEGGRFRL